MNNELAATIPATPATPAMAAGQAAKTAVPIEALLDWAYRRQMVFELWGAFWNPAAEARKGYGSAGAGMIEYARYGTDIDYDNWSGQQMPEQVHDDAVAVHRALSALPQMCQWPVLHHARDVAGGRPVLVGGPVVELRPALWRWKGARQVPDSIEIIDRVMRGGRVRMVRRRWYPIRLVDHGPEIMASRRTWRLWRVGLILLYRHFRSNPGELARWRVVPSLPPARPWREENNTRGLDRRHSP